jgi:uncharacterized protein YndB with AHSA1/START domain
MQRFELRLHTSAPAERLFALLSDAPGWRQWFPAARRVEWDSEVDLPRGIDVRRAAVLPYLASAR